MFRVIWTAFVLFFLAIPSAFSEPSARLVEIFCERVSHGTPFLSNEAAWQDLVQTMRRRATNPVDSTLRGVEAFSVCVISRERDFESAEFALKGLEILETAPRASGATEEPGLMLSAVTLAGMDFSLEPKTTERLPKMDAPESRRERYEQLWMQAVKELRVQLESHAL